jgi:hypothetical protein
MDAQILSFRELRRGPDRQSPALPEARPAMFLAAVPQWCPTCGGSPLKDYNAETVITPSAPSCLRTPGLLVHLHVCMRCGQKLFAPPK